MKDQTTLNNNFIMKKAMLKSENMQFIRKIEDTYFLERYGNFYHQINEIDASPILKFQSFILSNL